MADEKLYKAEYVGSGTFLITKPKRKKMKVRQTQLKNPQRGSRLHLQRPLELEAVLQQRQIHVERFGPDRLDL